MILEAEQRFSLSHPAGDAAALAFVRTPAVALAEVDFLRGLQTRGAELSGELLVNVPLLGQADLPFCSVTELTPRGARLRPMPLSGERAWIEVSGEAQVSGPEMHFAFNFRAHLLTPPAEGWGSAAFEKMAQATAGRTLARLTAALPAALGRSMQTHAQTQPQP